eukprot:TRINITY_DN50800_c0_g1_i1.p2 TRINITY_DN50800_c0_g1~~TRINITY_DN50800_c0_g1_i1.p2  ORF type:complete len:216 (+),score=39.34 TRINITY_DN50800_c0_g1_i1:156-803(+)
MQCKKDDTYDYLVKVVLVGDATVGKTHVLSRYIKGTVPNQVAATIGVEFAMRNVDLPGGVGTIKAQIWDTAGQERYRAITSAHYRKAAGALLVYDITKKATFENCSRWLQELRTGAGQDVTVVLVGNKVDLPEANPSVRQIAFDDANEFAKGEGLIFYEASALTGYNVTRAFESLFLEIHNRRKDQPPEDTTFTTGAVGLSLSPPVQKAGCDSAC